MDKTRIEISRISLKVCTLSGEVELMMTGKFKKYTWEDIEELIKKDSFGEDSAVWDINGFIRPEKHDEFIIEVKSYDKPVSMRT